MTLEQRLTALAQTIAGDVKTLFSRIGNLSSLNTTNKTDLVSAINEVSSNGGQSGAIYVDGGSALSIYGSTRNFDGGNA